MNKSEFVTLIAELNNITKEAANLLVNAFIRSLTAALMEGKSVQLVGFGSFEVKQIPEKKGRNPKTGDPITIQAHLRPTFKAGKSLKDVVSG